MFGDSVVAFLFGLSSIDLLGFGFVYLFLFRRKSLRKCIIAVEFVDEVVEPRYECLVDVILMALYEIFLLVDLGFETLYFFDIAVFVMVVVIEICLLSAAAFLTSFVGASRPTSSHFGPFDILLDLVETE